MAKVTVRMFATFREASGSSEVVLEARDLDSLLSVLRGRFGREFSDLLDTARSDPELIVVLLNGRSVGPIGRDRTKLRNGDEVAIFPPVSGG
jgi:molybdopterin synthase sulfur carrier subunit